MMREQKIIELAEEKAGLFDNEKELNAYWIGFWTGFKLANDKSIEKS